MTMHAVATSLVLPFRQLTDSAFRRPLFRGLGGAVVAFLALIWLADWGVAALLSGSGWWATLAGVLGGLLVLISALWLFVPVALAISGLFLDDVAEAVERRYYPLLPPAEGPALHHQIWAGCVLGLQMLGLTILIMPLGFLVPPLGAVAFWAVAALSLGYGLFDGVAQRRMSVEQSRLLRRQVRWPVLTVGAVLAALALVPIANLLVPVLGTAAMTHLLQRVVRPRVS
jgi:uncharacterized protein involved in cysteine biosynthesis